MTPAPPFIPVPLDPAHQDEAVALARRAGVHGVYTANALGADDPDGEAVLLRGADGLKGLLWFGRRGNLVILDEGRLSPEGVAGAVLDSVWPWRIALGEDRLVAALRQRLQDRPLVDREQVYYAIERAPGTPPTAVEHRLAVRKDLPALTRAALELNREDLSLDPSRVDREWLRWSLLDRIGSGTTWVVGPAGAPRCKVDLGSAGPAGALLEGVYTLPDVRGRGLAGALVAAVACELLAEHPLVCLHVAAGNASARHAYEVAGMQTVGSCRLLLQA